MNVFIVPDPAGGSGVLTLTIADDFGSGGNSLLESEDQSGENTITEHPVEVGPDVTDHARTGPAEVSYTWTISDTPIGFGAVGSPIQTTLDLPKFEPSLLSESALIDAGIGAIKDALFGTPPVVIKGFSYPDDYDAVLEMHNALEAIRWSKSACSVITSTRTLESMQISSVKCSRKEPGCASFTVSFKQIFTTTSATVDAPKPLQPRGATSKSGGKQGTGGFSETPPKGSALGGIVAALGGIVAG